MAGEMRLRASRVSRDSAAALQVPAREASAARRE